MSDMADVLRAHWSASTHTDQEPPVDKCDGCGAVLRAWGDDSGMPAQLAAHQAAALSAAGFGPVQEAQAEAWDEGHESGFWNGRESAGHHEMRYVGLEHAKLNNPYRKVSDDGS